MKVRDLMRRKRTRRERESDLDIILIHIDSFYNTRFSYFNMGLLYIATYLKEQGYNVQTLGIQDLFNMSYIQIKELFISHKPRVAGFYTTSDNIYQVKTFAGDVKQWIPDIITVTGGPLATSIGEEILKDPFIDMTVLGEGEFVMKEILEFFIDKKGSLKNINGLIFKEEVESGDKDGNKENGGDKDEGKGRGEVGDKEHGRDKDGGKGRGEVWDKKYNIVRNPPSFPIGDLDSLPYPDHGLVNASRSFHIVSGRGCPYNCIFCFQGVHGLKYRYRSAEKLVDEIIQNLINLPAKTFDIIDDTFIMNPLRVKEFSRRMIEIRKTFPKDFLFFCQGRVDILEKHPEILPLLKESGLARLQVGMESGSQEVLDIYKKRITIEQIKSIAKRVGDLGGMAMVGNFIIGGPFESQKTFRETLDLAKELISISPGAIEIGTAFMCPYPGTEVAQNPHKYGLKIHDNRFMKGLTLSDVHMTSDSLDVPALRRLGLLFYEELLQEFEKQLPRIPSEMLRLHFRWAKEFLLYSQWYENCLSKRPGLEAYFNYISSPRFKKLKEIQKEDIINWFPQRVWEFREYAPHTHHLVLPKNLERKELSDPDEILIYELSSGKLTIKQIIEEFQKERGIDENPPEILERILIPFYKRMEESYHIVFYR